VCGIFGGVGPQTVPRKEILTLSRFAEVRGKDSSGLISFSAGHFRVKRSDFDVVKLLKSDHLPFEGFVAGHSRLVTNGHNDNQPVYRDGIAVLHNGIITNGPELWHAIGQSPLLEIDSEILPALTKALIDKGQSIESAVGSLLDSVRGVVSMVMVFPELGKLALASNNGSLYAGERDGVTFFSSEQFPLVKVNCQNIRQVFEAEIFDIPQSSIPIEPIDLRVSRANLVPQLPVSELKSNLLDYEPIELRRCTKCILPETMPFISFGDDGVCNYCENYEPRNRPKDPSELDAILDRFRREDGRDCIFPFSGGRDSSYGLHLAVHEFGLKPIAYTYDWGMVTDLGRRNISRMCSTLGVENIIVAADISWKRNNIRRNLIAWLKSPHLGMISILTAGDKHFFQHVETVKKQTGISLNVWSVNPLEVTHFKAGFLGIPPDFSEKRVYRSGFAKQMQYQSRRFGAMLASPGYFNSSLFDTLSGEYHRSRSNKTDYYHLFDYWRWDEEEIDGALEHYDWERAPDTSTTWRIGDGTAAFYNYIYHRVAGFTEHDTFRSNQIREGDLSREEALILVEEENKPRYQNIQWYLDALGLDFDEVIGRVNNIPRLSG
jgi:glutamine---fructose-6-phosphate transaminase (isomerizing)